MSFVRVIVALAVIYALYSVYTGGGNEGETKVKEVQKIYRESLESLGFSQEKLKENYKKYDEVD